MVSELTKSSQLLSLSSGSSQMNRPNNNVQAILHDFYFPNFYDELLSNKLRDSLVFYNKFLNIHCENLTNMASDPSFKKDQRMSALFSKYKNQLNLSRGLSTVFEYFGKLSSQGLKEQHEAYF